MEKMKSYEEELVELQRKYLTPGSPDKSKRATGKDNFNMSQRTSGVQSTSSIPKSMTNVDVTDRLRAKIEKERQRGQELDEQISNYQDSIQDQRRQIAGVSKRGENKQDQSVASYLRSTQAQPNSFTGMGSSQQNYRQLAKQKEILENRLNKATQRYNQKVAHNKKLREEINNLRKERSLFEASYKKLEEDLAVKRNEMSEAIHAAEEAYKKRTEKLDKLEKLKKQSVDEQQQFKKEWNELLQEIEQVKKKKEFVQQREKEQMDYNISEIDAQDEEKIKELTSLSDSQKKLDKTQTLQLKEQYEEAFAKIQEETGVQSMQELVDSFKRYEERNANLYKFVEELEHEIQNLETQIANIKQKIEEYQQAGASTDTAKKQKLEEIESKLSTMEFRSEINEKIYKESRNIMQVLKDLLKKCIVDFQGNMDLVSEMDEQALTEANMVRYLGEIENCANDIIVNYAKTLAQKLQLEAILADDVNMNNQKIQALNNVLAHGTQSTEERVQQPIKIDPPSCEPDEEDGLDIEDYDSPLTREQFQAQCMHKAKPSKQPKSATKTSTKK